MGPAGISGPRLGLHAQTWALVVMWRLGTLSWRSEEVLNLFGVRMANHEVAHDAHDAQDEVVVVVEPEVQDPNISLTFFYLASASDASAPPH